MLTTKLKDFHNISFTEFPFPIITVYFNPSDFPNKYVARLWDVNEPTKFAVICDSLEEIQKAIPSRFVKINRFANDDPAILEVWL